MEQKTEKNGTIKIIDELFKKQDVKIDEMQANNFVKFKENTDKTVEKIDNVLKDVKSVRSEMAALETKLVKNSKGKPTTRFGLILQTLRNKDFQTFIENKVSGKKSDFAFDVPMNLNEIKDPGSFIAGDAPVVLPFREPGVSVSPTRPMMVSDLISWGTTESNMVDWIERNSKTDGSAPRLEGAVMGEGDLTYIEKSVKVKIMSEFIKVTNESLKDAGFLNSEINTELLTDIRLLVDSQLLNGDGAGANIKGIMEYAVAWAAGTFAGTVPAPNNADVLRVGINQIFVTGQGRWLPTNILMHPDDVTALDLLKITDGRYIDVPYYDGEKMTVIKVPIVQNVGIPAGEFLIADFTKAKGFIRDNLTIRIFDQNEDDPIYNRSTVLGNVRLAFRIKGPDEGAFVYGDFASAITALTVAP